MNKSFCNCHIFCACLLLIHVANVSASEQSLNANVKARVAYNDNLFLVDGPHESVTALIVEPSLTGVIKERNWETSLKALLRINKYSDHNLDNNDKFLTLAGSYSAQRDIFSMNINFSQISNLRTTSLDFGLSDTRVVRQNQTVAPSYTRLLTERATLSLTYVYRDVDFLDAENTNFRPFITHTGVVSLQYRLTEKDSMSVSLQAIDYESQDKLVTYQLFVSNVGLNHAFSETLSTNLKVGVSRQNATNLVTQEFDFFGNIIFLRREVDSESRNLVLNAGVTQLLESGSVNANISRTNNTNSTGGLDTNNRFAVNYNEKLSELWGGVIEGAFSDIDSVRNGVVATDRKILIFRADAKYSITVDWKFEFGYKFVQRKFKSDMSDERAPHSNMLYVGLSYNFPPLSTF